MPENKEVRVWHCKKCRHGWANRKPRKPKTCPKCKSVNWDEA